MSTSKVLVGVLAGLAAGALLGVLFAPDKGSETRKKIAKKGEDSLGDIKEKLDELINNFSEDFETAKAEAAESLVYGKDHIGEVKKDIKSV